MDHLYLQFLVLNYLIEQAVWLFSLLAIPRLSFKVKLPEDAHELKSVRRLPY